MLRVRSPAMQVSEYYIITSREGGHPKAWCWEIQRRSKPMGVKLSGDGYQSEAAAEFASKRALAELLKALSKEELGTSRKVRK
jgi:hypothetical protein